MRSSCRLRELSRFVLAGATVLVVTLCSAAQQTQPLSSIESKSAEQEIRQLIARYAKSVDDADITVAAQVWLDSPDVSFIHPLGHEHGSNAYAAPSRLSATLIFSSLSRLSSSNLRINFCARRRASSASGEVFKPTGVVGFTSSCDIKPSHE